MDKNKIVQKEKYLITSFLDNFYMEMGYFPTVFGKYYRDQVDLKVATLPELRKCFDPFLPTKYGKKLTLTSKYRIRELVELRCIFSYLAKKLGYSLKRTGQFLGNRDHTTILNNLRVFRNLYETDENFKNKYLIIITHIKKFYESPVMDHLDKVED